MQLSLADRDYVELGKQFASLALNSVNGALSPEFAATKSGSKKPKQCQKGFACGAGCVSKTKECKSPLQGQAKTYAGWLKLQIAAGGKLSKDQQTDADAMGLTKPAANPSAKPKKKPATPPAPAPTPKPAPDPASAPKAGKFSLVQKFDDAQEKKLLREWVLAESDLRNNASDKTELENLRHTVGLAKVIASESSKKPDNYRSLMDADNNIQATAYIRSKKSKKGDSLYIEYLSSAPWNVSGNDPRRVKGAGTEMLKALVEESIKRGFDGRISLEALDEAIPFYKKMGFTGPKKNMVLEPAAAHKLLYGNTAPPAPAATTKPSKAPDPDPAKISTFSKKTLVSSVNKEQESALQDWRDYSDKVFNDPAIPQPTKDRAFMARALAGDSQDFAKGGQVPDGYRALVDKNGVTQSIALVTVKKSTNGDSLSIENISTAPWNIVGNDPRSTKGAGTEMMKVLVEESIKRGFDGRVSLTALPDAAPFYQKLGFTGPNWDMELSPQAAHKLLYG